MIKQVIVVRKDLKLRKGKLATQVAHAALLSYEKSRYKREWKREGQRKIVVFCKNEKELLLLEEKAKKEELPFSLVADAGLTYLKRGTRTSLGIGPAPGEKIDRITGKLKLV